MKGFLTSLLFATLIFFGDQIFAQYQSVIGQNKVDIYYLREVADAVLLNQLTIEGDTTIEGELYKIVLNNELVPGSISVEIGFIREDSITGKLWFKNKTGGREDLIMDLGLEVGDSFYIPLSFKGMGCSDIYYEVINVEIVNGRKVITLNTPEICEYFEQLQFIEGVGPNNTILFTSDQGDFFGWTYQLCKVVRDGVLYYEHQIDCHSSLSTKDVNTQTPNFLVYPSVCDDFMYVNYQDNILLTDLKISLLNLDGKHLSQYSLNEKKQRINLINTNPGILVYQITSEGKIIQAGKLVKK